MSWTKYRASAQFFYILIAIAELQNDQHSSERFTVAEAKNWQCVGKLLHTDEQGSRPNAIPHRTDLHFVAGA